MVKKNNNNNLFYYFLLFIILLLLILLISYYYYINNNKINFENDNLYEIKHKYYKLENKLNNKDNELNNIKNKYNQLEDNLNNKDKELNNIINKYNQLEYNLDDFKINKDNEINDIKNKYNLLENNSSNFKNDDNKVCMNIDMFNKLNHQNINNNDTTERDYRVINDPLFPPFNRSDRNTHTHLRNNINKRNMYVNTNNIDDTFRLVAYITCTDENKDIGNNSWKLFGREKDRHFSEFYMTPTDNTNDIKIFLNDNIINGNKVRDIYNIPEYINFNSHMLNSSPYYVNEIPKQNLSYQNFYM